MMNISQDQASLKIKPLNNEDVGLNANFIVSQRSQNRQGWVKDMAFPSLLEIQNNWPFWARREQLEPKTEWNTWLFMGGRGAGKTRAGAQWLTTKIAKGVRCALIGPTLGDVREVMIEGPSGLKCVADHDNRPTYEVSRKRLSWPKGGVAYAFSAEDCESLRGPQFHHAWADEFCAWKKPSDMLAQLRLGLRLGTKPQLCVTTTPKPITALKQLMSEAGVCVSRSSTKDNVSALSDGFLNSLNALYGGTRLAQQELEGLIVDSDDQALWQADELMRCYGARPPRLDQIVVAVDPPITSHGDACGIVVAGRLEDRGYVLCDASVSGLTPLAWANRVVELVEEYKAHKVVAEANQGGEMIRSLLAVANCKVVIDLVHARVGKRSRAEPVAALYEQGRITHAPENQGGRFSALDEELMALGSKDMNLGHSPDRADALVWALTSLLITHKAEPHLRYL